MYKIIIADDEPWVAFGLSRLVTYEEFGFEVVSIAHSGTEALEQINRLNPDTVLSDIRMPGLSGLDLMETIYNTGEHVKFVFISGYSDFEYTQKAIRLGAFDYLIKQVTKKSLSDTLLHLKKELDAEKEHSSGLNAPFSIIDESSDYSIAEWLKLRNIEFAYSYYCFCTFKLFSDEQSRFINIHSDPDFGQIMIHTGRDKSSVLLGYHRRDTLESRWHIEENRMCGYSPEKDPEFSFYALYSQSNIAYATVLFFGNETSCHYYTLSEDGNVSEHCIELDTYLQKEDYSTAKRLLEEIKFESSGYMLNEVCHIYNRLSMILSRYSKEKRDNFDSYTYLDILQYYNNIDELFEGLTDELSKHIDAGDNDIWSNIQTYIDNQYTRSLKLTELAEMFHFSTNYFSTIFKRKFGKNFSKYVTEKRIALAKELLHNTTMPIQDIADRTGYSDYFQFSKIFKKEVGETPAKFRGQHN